MNFKELDIVLNQLNNDKVLSEDIIDIIESLNKFNIDTTNMI